MTKLVLSLLLFYPLGAHAGVYSLCPTIQFEDQPPFKFSSDEITLICGDKKGGEIQSEVWSSIPPAQAKLHLKAMLQIRGYHKAKYEIRGDVLHVDLGPATLASHIFLDGAPPNLDINRKRKIVGENLTPDKLDELQDWVTFELKHVGFPCPSAEITANYLSGEILVKVNTGPKLKITDLTADEIGDLHPGVIRRYDAFHVGDDYDIWNITLTERRVLDDDMLIGNHFITKCMPYGAHLHQTVRPGLPRLFQAGVGFDTEQGPEVKISSHYTRMNQRGSILDNTITASLRIQEFTSSLNWYVLRNPSRFYLKPNFDITRDKEPAYEYVETKLGMLGSVTWDDPTNRWDLSIGPSYQVDHTSVGVGPVDSRNLFINESLLWTTHSFEYFKDSPQRGFKFGLNSLSSNKSLASSVTASQILFTGTTLFNVGEFSPPSLVFGLRGLIGTTATADGASDLTNLPPALRYYLGGTQDLRGFSRQELPDNGGYGALTEAYLGFETRFTDLLPAGLQPFLFADGGLVSTQPWTLAWPLYWSPGFGVRWASPVGAFRVELAHGFVDAPSGATAAALDSSHSHWQFYFSYGEEF